MENTQKQNNKQTKKVVKKEGFLKKYWHIIVISILLLFGMMQCTKSCSRKGNIALQNVEIQKRDSIIDNLELRVDTLSNSLNYYKALYESEIQHNSNFTSIATGNQNELYSQMNKLNNDILSLQNDKIKLEKTIKNLNSENNILKDSLVYYRRELNKKIE